MRARRGKKRRPGFFQEQDGAFSVRRLLAVAYAVSSIRLYFIGAEAASMPAVYAGIACTVAAIVYPILTTIADVKGVLGLAARIRGGHEPDYRSEPRAPNILDK